jgi:type II secretion system (T2SS) protein E
LREARRRIGEVLVADGLLTENAVNRALGYQRLSGDTIKLGSILLNWDLLDEESLLSALAKVHRATPVPWSAIKNARMEVVQLLPAAFAKRVGAIAYDADKGLVRVAFINPNDIAAVDEAAAIAGRRVIAGVTTELRILQAHNRFYGRPLPLEYRNIIVKIQRKASGASRPTGVQTPPDFRADDFVRAERESHGVAPAPPFAIPVAPRGSTDQDLSFSDRPGEPVQIEVPEMPPIESSTTPQQRPTPVRPSPKVAPEVPIPPSGPAHPGRETPPQLDETMPVSNEQPPRWEDFSQPAAAEDSLADWVGEALMSFHPDSQVAAPSETPATSDPLPSAPPETPAPASAKHEPKGGEDLIAGMWQAAPPEHEESVASGMWTSLGDEPGPVLHEERSREEIADTILANALTDLPRVILLGIGRTFITGWRGRGPGLTPERVAGIRVPVSAVSIFATVRDSGAPHFGAVNAEEWTAALRAVLGSVPPECAVFPIRVGEDVAAFLYADRFGEPMQYEDFAKIARAAASAAGVLARFLLRQDAPVG